MPTMKTDREHWSKVASEWTAWARAPNHDGLLGVGGSGFGMMVGAYVGRDRAER